MEWLSLFHVPSTFAPANTHANVFFVFLTGGISKEWHHIVSANCKLLRRYRIMFTGLSGNTWGDQKLLTSQNDVRRLLAELGLRKPPSGTPPPPRGSLCWENLCGWGRLVGGTDWGDCGRKVSTQRKYACVFAGSDVQGKCKRNTLILSSVLTYRCMYVGLCIMHGRRKRGQGAAAPSGEWGGSDPPTMDIPHPIAYILIYIL